MYLVRYGVRACVWFEAQTQHEYAVLCRMQWPPQSVDAVGCSRDAMPLGCNRSTGDWPGTRASGAIDREGVYLQMYSNGMARRSISRSLPLPSSSSSSSSSPSRQECSRWICPCRRRKSVLVLSLDDLCLSSKMCRSSRFSLVGGSHCSFLPLLRVAASSPFRGGCSRSFLGQMACWLLWRFCGRSFLPYCFCAFLLCVSVGRANSGSAVGQLEVSGSQLPSFYAGKYGRIFSQEQKDCEKVASFVC